MVKTYNCSCNRNIFGDAAILLKDCSVLFGDIFIVPFSGSALGLTAMCSLGWGILVAFDWNDLPVEREFDRKFLKKVKSQPYALPPPPLPRRHYIDRCITAVCLYGHVGLHSITFSRCDVIFLNNDYLRTSCFFNLQFKHYFIAIFRNYDATVKTTRI